jgi:hypothetical protein
MMDARITSARDDRQFRQPMIAKADDQHAGRLQSGERFTSGWPVTLIG